MNLQRWSYRQSGAPADRSDEMCLKFIDSGKNHSLLGHARAQCAICIGMADLHATTPLSSHAPLLAYVTRYSKGTNWGFDDRADSGLLHEASTNRLDFSPYFFQEN